MNGHEAPRDAATDTPVGSAERPAVTRIVLWLALAACGKTQHQAPTPGPNLILEQALDHYSECLQDDVASEQTCTSCHSGGEPTESLAKVLIGGQYIDVCLPGLL